MKVSPSFVLLLIASAVLAAFVGWNVKTPVNDTDYRYQRPRKTMPTTGWATNVPTPIRAEQTATSKPHTLRSAEIQLPTPRQWVPPRPKSITIKVPAKEKKKEQPKKKPAASVLPEYTSSYFLGKAEKKHPTGQWVLVKQPYSSKPIWTWVRN